MEVSWSRFHNGIPDIAGRSLGVSGYLLPRPNRGSDCAGFGEFYAAWAGGGGDSENEEPLSSATRQNEGRSARWQFGRGSPSVFRILQDGIWELSVPNIPAVISEGNSLCLANLRGPGAVW